jgi:hypothetical protein
VWRTIRRVTPTAGVAARVAGLALDDDGGLPDDAYAAVAVRGGLLVDLALAHRLDQDDDSIELDPTPTGRAAADRALDELGALDGRTLDWWLQHSHLGLDDLAAALVADGTWAPLPARPLHRRPRFEVRDTATVERDRALLDRSEPVADPGADPSDAAVVAIAVAAGLRGGQAGAAGPEDRLRRTGPVEWVCRVVVDLLTRARIDGRAVSSASQTALWSGLPY